LGNGDPFVWELQRYGICSSSKKEIVKSMLMWDSIKSSVMKRIGKLIVSKCKKEKKEKEKEKVIILSSRIRGIMITSI
jgi:predicted Fe-S protein YdhL (DUF1289 family)